MNKTTTLFLLQSAQTIFSVGMWTVIVLIWYRIKFKTSHGIREYIGLHRPSKGAFLRSARTISIAYLFTIAVYFILKIVNGGMEAKILTEERKTVSLPFLLIIILMVGLRSGFGEELFFRGLIANRLFAKTGKIKANLLQALIFMIPHILTFAKLPGLESGLLLVNAFVIGLALGQMTYREEGCIVPAIVYHGVINIIAIPITWYLM